ncbi:MAG: peptidase S10, partial [Acidobacteria bacterium]|nr:peptidase S10 [Acidobacteriota bacterium]
MNRIFTLTAALLLAVCVVQAQPDPSQRTGRRGATEQQPTTTPPATTTTARPATPLEEKSSVTKGSVRIGGQQINYTATAATYVIKADDGTPKATFFFVGYTKDEVSDKAKRPLSFIYNGGPGSASS